MIQITKFDDYLAADVKRGKVKNPRWFRQRCSLSAEAQVLLAGDNGPAIYGVWVLLQQWANRHPRKSGKFQMGNGVPMDISEVSTVIGIPGQDDLVKSTINRVLAIGWAEPWTKSMECPHKVQEVSTSEERRGEERREESSKINLAAREKIEVVPDSSASYRKIVDLVTKWKGFPSGLLEARLAASVIKMTTESPLGENCPQEAAQALLRHAVESGNPYISPNKASIYLHGIWDQWRNDGKIPSSSREAPQEV